MKRISLVGVVGSMVLSAAMGSDGIEGVLMHAPADPMTISTEIMGNATMAVEQLDMSTAMIGSGAGNAMARNGKVEMAVVNRMPVLEVAMTEGMFGIEAMSQTGAMGSVEAMRTCYEMRVMVGAIEDMSQSR